jgi:uncharacterized protein (TIGR00369 family)
MPTFPTFNEDIAKALPMYTSRSPYASLIGIEIIETGPGMIRARVPVTDKLASGVGAVHGGAIVSLVDHCLSLAVYPLVEIGKWVATLELKLNYLSPARMDAGGELIARAEVIALKKRVAVVRVDVTHGEDLVASAQGTVYVRDGLK